MKFIPTMIGSLLFETAVFVKHFCLVKVYSKSFINLFYQLKVVSCIDIDRVKNMFDMFYALTSTQNIQ